MTQKRTQVRKGAGRSATDLELSVAEVQDLVTLSTYYEQSMGPFRHVIRLTSNRETRAKLGFIRQESYWLNAWAQAVQADVRDLGSDIAVVPFTPRSLIAFWGRALASLNTPRSRRRLKGDRLAVRESLTAKLGAAVQELRRSQPELVEAEVATRREREVAWMRDLLPA